MNIVFRFLKKGIKSHIQLCSYKPKIENVPFKGVEERLNSKDEKNITEAMLEQLHMFTPKKKCRAKGFLRFAESNEKFNKSVRYSESPDKVAKEIRHLIITFYNACEKINSKMRF